MSIHRFASCFRSKKMALASLVLCLLSTVAIGQIPSDTVHILNEVIVKAYESDRPSTEIAASISVVNQSTLNRFSNTSFVPVFNSLAGIRMEERSPGSYRFSIRGSLLRSPFGIRNVKFYWNGLPLTDGGGNTYFNLLDFSSIGKAEVIKGPGGSLYGAGTGGVVLLSAPSLQEDHLQVTSQFGSFGAERSGISFQTGVGPMVNSIQYVHQKSEGYRKQSAMRRDAFNADISIFADSRNTIRLTFFYTDLYYQTPGGLTKAQYDVDPSQARPAAGSTPGAETQQAAVRNKSNYEGLVYEHLWSDQWSTSLGVFASNSEFKNASIRNYESRSEGNFGARLGNRYKFDKQTWSGKVSFGAEFQHFNSPILVVNNVNGTPGSTIFTHDDATSLSALGFSQAEIDLPNQIYVTLGASINYLAYEVTHLNNNPIQKETRRFNPVVSPRVAVLKKISPALAAYASVSKGFSPPSIAEVIPSTGIYNPALNPETGWSYEVGIKGTVKKVLPFTISFYNFQLNNTIVVQRDASGADYFVNAGNTNQNGLELESSWKKSLRSGFISSLNLWTSFTYNHYRFGTYAINGQNFSGNQLTGIAPAIAVLGIDLVSKVGLYANITANYVDRLPLHDGNADYAQEYLLLGGRIGHRSSGGKFPFDFFLGGDNLLNQKYSLGNDLNAAGGRYYNAAAPVNFYVGFISKLFFRKGQKAPDRN